MDRPARLLYVYAPEDESLQAALAKHLAPLEKLQRIRSWHVGWLSFRIWCDARVVTDGPPSPAVLKTAGNQLGRTAEPWRARRATPVRRQNCCHTCGAAGSRVRIKRSPVRAEM